MLIGNNGILTQAQKAKEETKNAQLEEENILASYENYLNVATGTNTEFTDSYGNKVIVPAGFKVINPEDNVEDGIVIEDAAYENTKGSQFVWIPVGTIQTSKGEITINLDRYTFTSEGIAIGQGNNEIEGYIDTSNVYPCQELLESKYGNTTSKNINSFLSRTRNSGGYYLGRYEARNNNDKLAENNSYTIYNNVTQPQAAVLSQNMYNNIGFESDLVNSYAWDTAIVFIQSCSDKVTYSQQPSLNSNYEEYGTTDDVVCNIYDIASNCIEWSTETSKNDLSLNCVYRGGVYDSNFYFASVRCGYYSNNTYATYSFRPILYL